MSYDILIGAIVIVGILYLLIVFQRKNKIVDIREIENKRVFSYIKGGYNDEVVISMEIVFFTEDGTEIILDSEKIIFSLGKGEYRNNEFFKLNDEKYYLTDNKLIFSLYLGEKPDNFVIFNNKKLSFEIKKMEFLKVSNNKKKRLKIVHNINIFPMIEEDNVWEEK